jgi:photoactive yellow protein
MAFVSEDLIAKLGTLTRAEADAQPHGVIRVDDEGVIELYNRFEAELAGIAPGDAEGRSFFTEVAPCTNNRLVYGRFQAGMEAGEMDFSLRYTFTYRMRPTNVRLHLLRDPASETNWIFVAR